MRIENPKLLKTFRTPGRCENCGRFCQVREPAHLWAKGFGGGGWIDLRINLISLGSSRHSFCACHSISHNDGGVLNATFLGLIAWRERTTEDSIIEVMHLCRRLVKPTQMELHKAVGELAESPRLLAVKEFTEAGLWEKPKVELTPKQKAVVDFIREFRRMKGYPPTFRDIADGLGLRYHSSAQKYIRTLSEKGALTFNSHTSRSIVLCEDQA